MAETKVGLNLHLLVSPDAANHVEEIERSFEELKISYKDRTDACTRQRLIEFGYAYNSDLPADLPATALREGVRQFKVDFAAFRAWYGACKWLCRNSIIAVAAGNDGLSGINWESGWGATKEEIIRICGAIFSGPPRDRDYFLGNRDPDFLERLGGSRPCFHGSDAHSLEKLFAPDMKRYCWIKADTTYEGLRQTLLEPEDRVWIGEQPPAQHQNSKTIRSVRLSDTGGMFEEISLPLNPGLVAVIGQKGMGKSALVECIAYGGGGWVAYKGGTFIEPAKRLVAGVTVELTWADGSSEIVSLGQPYTGEAKTSRYVFCKRFVRTSLVCTEREGWYRIG